jgi:hypothetical protein
VEIAATLVGPAELVEPAASVALAVSAGPVESVGSVELVGLAELVERVARIAHPRCPRVVGGIALPRCHRMVVDAATGSTIPNTAEAHRIETARPRIDLVARRAVIRSPIARPALGNRLDGKAAICQATARELAVRAIGLEAPALATGQVEAEQIALEVVIFLAAAAETGMPSAEVPAVITDRVPDPTAVAVHPAWGLGAEAGAVARGVVGVGGADSR